MKKIMILFCAICSLAVFAGCGAKKIDLMDYAEVKMSGFDEHGTAIVSLNWPAFQNAAVNEKDKNEVTIMNNLMLLQNSIKYSLDKKTDLKNGDTISLSVSWDKNLAKNSKLSLVGQTKKIKVSDLKPLTKVDAFKDFGLEYEGVSPNARAIIKNASSDGFVKSLGYSLDVTNGIANGDEITVTVSMNEQTALQRGYIISETKKKFVVSGLDEYIKEYAKIDKDTLEKMKQQSTDLIESALADGYQFKDYIYPGEYKSGLQFDSLKVASLALKNAYFFVLKDGIAMSGNDVNNSIFLIYELKFNTNVSPSETEQEIVYIPVYFKNFILRDGKTIDVNITEAKVQSTRSQNFDNVYRDIVTKNKAKYTFEEITY